MAEPKQLSWDDVNSLVSQIVQQIQKGSWRPDVIIGMSRGGFIPATMIAQKLGVKSLVGLDVAKDSNGVRSLGKLVRLNDLSQQNVLIVDDSIITGRLLSLAAGAVRAKGGDPRTCALISEGITADPDYFVETQAPIPVFPWE